MVSKRNGFSLVELSIVLVILGLLTGGILGGQALIKAAEMRAVTTELNNWQTAINSFKDKYMGLPGDLRNAGDFWGYINTGGANGNCSAPATNTGTGTQTCSGDGDGNIDQSFESFRFWQHLANAGLINGEFTGINGGSGTEHTVGGENVPRSKFGNASWNVTNFGDAHPGMDGFNFMGSYGDTLFIGQDWFNSWNTGPVFTPEEAWNIDTKVDDGKPTTGSVWASPNGTCTDAGTDSSDVVGTEYALSEDSAQCPLYFRHAF